MSNSLTWLTTKERFARKNLTKIIFFIYFLQFVPLPLLSLFAQSLFFIETLWANRQVALNKRATMSNSSQRSLQKSNCERFTHVAHDNKATGAFCSFSRANRSFPHKKRANCFKNRWANSQSCIFSLSKSRVTCVSIQIVWVVLRPATNNPLFAIFFSDPHN